MRQATRNLKVNILIADMAGELPNDFKLELYNEFLQIAQILEVKE